jgi:hypothetical protein
VNLTAELKTWLLLKNLLRVTTALEQGLTEQNQLLRRIADRIAPVVEQEPVEPNARSVDYSTDDTQLRILVFSEDVLRKTGRYPTEEEVVEHLEEDMRARRT